MAGGNPWKISALISACYEFVLALFLLFRMLLAVILLEFSKYLPLSRACSCCSHGRHNLFCSGHFPAFSPCVKRSAARAKETVDASGIPARFPRGSLPGKCLPEGYLTEKKMDDLGSTSKKVGVSDQGRSLSLSSVYKRKKRTSSLKDNAFVNHCKGSVDLQSCQCIGSELDLYDDLIEVSSEYLKQKDRGHEEVIVSLLKALQAERRNLRILYEDLEEERVASETAANEAMSMILRLQDEKSALQMEADHYRRLAEEKALHDEHAIQLLEEDLCLKESERLRLEEELSLLRDRCYGGFYDVREDVDDATYVPQIRKPLLLLTDIDEVSLQEENGNALNSQDDVDQSCVSAGPEASLKAGQVKDQPLKKRKSFIVFEKGSSKESSASHGTVESAVPSESSPSPELCQLFKDDQDDAKTILVQLSALEKQLLALEELERLDSLHQAQHHAQENHLTCLFVKPEGNCVINYHAEDEIEGVSKKDVSETASEADLVNMPDEEKVVNVDIANVEDGSYCDAQMPAAEEILEFHEGQLPRSNTVQWEVFEEEKHLDMPSFVSISHLNSASTSPSRETCKPDVQILQGFSPGFCQEDENWNAKRVTLEGLNLRLQALENESTLMRHGSVPSNRENTSVMLLREIMQELQELLIPSRNGSTNSKALPSMTAHVKGGPHKKRLFSDGPGQLS